MKKMNLIIAVVAILAVLAGWYLATGNQRTEFSSNGIFPDLQVRIEQVDSLKVSNASGLQIDAVKQDGQWLDASKGQYPINNDEVIALLNALVTAKLDTAKTAKPENFSRLGLQDISQENSKAQLLTIKAGEHQWSLLVGNKASSGMGIYVRKPEQQQTWLSKSNLELPTEPEAWLQKQILNMPLAEISDVARTGSWHIVASETTEEAGTGWQFAEVIQDRELQYESILDSTVENIVSLHFDNLYKPRPYALPDDSLQSETRITTKSGDTISLKLYKVEDADVLTLDSETLDGVWEQWAYQLSAFNAGRLTKNKDDFLQPLPEQEAEIVESAQEIE